MNDVDKLLKEFEVLAIYTYSPFLYGGHVYPKYWESQVSAAYLTSGIYLMHLH